MMDKEELLKNKIKKDQENGPGIYYLFDGDEIVYIGQSENPHNRILQHFPGKKFDSYTIVNCPSRELNKRESDEILKYLPKYNKNIPLRGTGIICITLDKVHQITLNKRISEDKEFENKIKQEKRFLLPATILRRNLLYINLREVYSFFEIPISRSAIPSKFTITDGACPHNFKFGNDFDQHKECDECDIWSLCRDKNNGKSFAYSCPHNYKCGEDFDKYPACDECNMWKRCKTFGEMKNPQI